MSNDKHTPTPWIYRPHRHDDWGFIRDSQGDLVAVAKNSKISFSEHDGFRSRKEDPYEANAKRIVQCVNEYDGLIETIATLRAEKAELIEALRATKTILQESYHPRTDIVKDIVYYTLAKYETK
jgi:hypothetical protein